MSIKVVSNQIGAVGRYVSASLRSPSRSQVKTAFFFLGAALLVVCAANSGFALAGEDKLYKALNTIGQAVTGTFGALIMVATGVGVIVSSAMGQYRAAWGLLVVALGALILRGAITAFFNVDDAQLNF